MQGFGNKHGEFWLGEGLFQIEKCDEDVIFLMEFSLIDFCKTRHQFNVLQQAPMVVLKIYFIQKASSVYSNIFLWTIVNIIFHISSSITFCQFQMLLLWQCCTEIIM